MAAKKTKRGYFRVFDGKMYEAGSIERTASRGREVAADYRRAGYLARSTQSGNKWIVWVGWKIK